MRSLNLLSQLTTVTRPSGTTEEKMLHHGHDKTPGGQACLDQWLWLTRCSSRCCRYRRSLHSRLNLKTSVRARRMCSLCRGPGGQLSSQKVLVPMEKQHRSEPIPQLPFSFSASSAYALWFSARAVAVLPTTNTTVVRACTAACCRASCAVITCRADPVTSGLRLQSTKRHHARQHDCK